MQGNVKNSSDQSNEDKPIKEIQTDEILTENFENQCPEDFFRTFGIKNEDEEDLQNLENTQRFLQYFIQFIIKFLHFSMINYINFSSEIPLNSSLITSIFVHKFL